MEAFDINTIKKAGFTNYEVKKMFADYQETMKTTTIDLSIVGLLTRMRSQDIAVRCTGDPFNISKDGTKIEMNLEPVTIPGMKAIRYNGYPVLVDGDYVRETMDIDDPYLYFMSRQAYSRLCRMTRVTMGMDPVLRNNVLAQKVNAMPDEFPVSIVYRTDEGIKTITDLSIEQHPVVEHKDIVNHILVLMNENTKIIKACISPDKGSLRIKGPNTNIEARWGVRSYTVYNLDRSQRDVAIMSGDDKNEFFRTIKELVKQSAKAVAC